MEKKKLKCYYEAALLQNDWDVQIKSQAHIRWNICFKCACSMNKVLRNKVPQAPYLLKYNFFGGKNTFVSHTQAIHVFSQNMSVLKKLKCF